jgi:hypothetical protein
MDVGSRNYSRFIIHFRVDFMSERRNFRQTIAMLAAVLLPLMLVGPATALSMKECSVRYKAAQDAGEAAGVSWSEFRRTQSAQPAGAAATDTPAKPETNRKVQSLEREAGKNSEESRTGNHASIRKDNFSFFNRRQILGGETR